jgi:hypothetical protein
LALNSGEWLFRFFILDHFFRHAIHLNDWSEFSGPPLKRQDYDRQKTCLYYSPSRFSRYHSPSLVSVNSSAL